MALLANEGIVGTFESLRKIGKRGDNLTPHHLPADALMQVKAPGYTRGQGIAIMMEAPATGGGRHRLTASYGRSPDLSLSPRQALAFEILDVRGIYSRQGLYSAIIKRALLKVIRLNRSAWSGIF